MMETGGFSDEGPENSLELKYLVSQNRNQIYYALLSSTQYTQAHIYIGGHLSSCFKQMTVSINKLGNMTVQ